ncbi:cation:proton antiporter [Aerococcaceae bacterium INB8]|uniref:Cation:proton antiporter n=1 Tax=Ruoffia halotolerans TaxID=2748684 RepID=A0A839A7E5_9LACT|nr:cation:proton antiporter [Ruoffia halotolerans]MBA5729821.1 cation:proton antiporter [Ruoffia halotolerans]
MLVSVALILVSGVVLEYSLKKLNLPALLGYLIAGILLGPFGLNLVDSDLLRLSPDIRQVALIVILTRAGLSLDIKRLLEVGRPAIMMCFVPASVEIMTSMIFGPLFFGFSLIQSLLIGAILAAVSPAVVVPRMVDLIQTHRGTKKQVPQMILAGASLDDVFVLVLFSAFLTIALGGSVSAWTFMQVPISIISGILGGAVLGYLLIFLFVYIQLKRVFQVMILLASGMVLMRLETVFTGLFSGILAVISMNIMIRTQSEKLSNDLSGSLNQIWFVAEIFLFFLVGVSVNPANALSYGFLPILFIILLSLCRLFIGVRLCLLDTPFNKKEKRFVLMSYLPKATVQAAIGSVPLANGIPGGELMLTLAVLSILITAPIGAIGMDYFAPRLLTNDSE